MAKVDIKGVNQSLVLVFSNGTKDEYEAILKNKFESNRQVFEGSPVLFQGEGLQELSPDDVASLQRLCLDFGMILHNVHVPTRRDNNGTEDKFIYRTLRSGQMMHSEGSLIIWGNVHESSEITAAKDIIVLGKLEGIAHAGCYGDTTSTIFALNLCPKQIRIGNKISRSGDEIFKSSVPETAYIEEETICIKEYSPR